MKSVLFTDETDDRKHVTLAGCAVMETTAATKILDAVRL
jgi:hypothetical protein